MRSFFIFCFVLIRIAQCEGSPVIQPSMLGEAWMDSAVCEGVRKISEARYADQYNNGQPFIDPSTGEQLGSHYIVIDLAKWTPNIVNNVFYYERASNPSFYTSSNSPWKTWDSINAYNIRNAQQTNYIALYNIVLKNFPMALEKDISSVNCNEGQSLFTQLQQIGAVNTDSFMNAKGRFQLIIDNIATLASNIYQGPTVIYGSANLLGQYGDKPHMRASFGAYYVKTNGFATIYPWLTTLTEIPKSLCPPITLIQKPSIEEKNFQIATAVQHYIECNAYGVCIMDGAVFANPYAKWLFDKLKGNSIISQPLLLSTCMRLNGLSQEFAWSVLTADYENTYTTFNTAGLSIPYYSNSTLDTISGLITSILRGAEQMKFNDQIGRDSALYFGRLLYRIPSYILEISTAQRVKLLDFITNSTCNDIMSVTDASDYENHCERIAKALYTQLPPGEEKNFLQLLRNNNVIWDLSYRLDNSTFGFFGNDNYTEFIFTISAYWKKAYPEFSQPANSNNINWRVVKWESSFFNSNGAVVADEPNNKIKLYQHARQGATVAADLVESPLDIYDPVTIHVAEGSFIPDLPGIKNLTVPAIFLDWLYHKKTLDDAATATRVTIAVIALTTGIGEFYAATSVTMQVLSGLEIAISTADLILINESARQTIVSQFPTPQEGENFLAAYDRISMAINICVAAKGLIVGLEADFANYTAKFDAEESALRTALGEQSAEFKGMKKVRDEIGIAKTAHNFLEGLSPHLRAIHDRFQLAGTEFKLEADKIIYYGRENNIQFELGRIENGDFIVTPVKPNIPDYPTYLNSIYSNNHLGMFQQQGAAFVIRKRDVIASNYNTLAPRKFCGLKSDMDGVIQKYNLANQNKSVLINELDLGENYFLPDDEVFYVIVKPEKGFTFDLPNGNEGGAYPGYWVPGGYTKHNTAEAVISNSGNYYHNKNWDTFVNLFGSENVIALN